MSQDQSRTTDLVSRLRQFHAECVGSDGGESEQMAMIREAADEIERSRGLLGGMANESLGGYCICNICQHEFSETFGAQGARCTKCGAWKT